MSSAINFNLDQSNILLSGNGLDIAKMMISSVRRVETWFSLTLHFFECGPP